MTTNGGATWATYNAASVPPNVNGVRVRVVGNLEPTAWVQLSLVVERRAGVADGVTIANCVGAVHDTGTSLFSNVCASVTSDDPDSSATISKDIVKTSLPAWTPGQTRQESGVQLRVANTGNLSASQLQLIDDDADFFDAVDFVRFNPSAAPSGANRVRVDARVGSTWTNGSVVSIGSTFTPALPGGVQADQVTGLRFTFTNSDTTTNGGFVIPPCEAGVTASCAGSVSFDISPRPALRSDPNAALPTTLANTVNGTSLTAVDNGVPKATPPATDTIDLVSGDPKLDVDKAPNNTTMGPGSTGLQTLRATNNGTVWLGDVSIVDVLPAGLTYDEAYDSGDGNSYAVEVTGLPTGYPAPPAPTYVVDRAGERIASVSWTFEGWQMPPNATITITIPVTLEPGVTAGQRIDNTMGATGTSGTPGKDLACTTPDGTSTDGTFGDGRFCTDSASVTVIAGAAFQARKWVAGDASLGWWHPTLGFVETGAAACPSITSGGRQYTATPCIALVRRGGQFDYILRVVNAGTEAATRMALVDNFPHGGDRGLVGGLARGTEWNNRPTLAGAASYVGPATGTISYSSAAANSWCTADLQLDGPGCGAGSWADGAGASTTALRFLGDFTAAPLAPGASIEIRFTMNVPSSLDQDGDVTIAWNSFAHAEETLTAQGGERILPPIEPIKVGVSPALAAKVSVGDFVWVDTDRDGRQDPGEPGIPGVRLTITGPGGGAVTDVFGNPVGPVTTDGNGLYLFDNLPVLLAGQSYTVHIDMASPALRPYVPTTPGVGDRGGDSSTGSATSGELTVDGAQDLTLDFGFILQGSGSGGGTTGGTGNLPHTGSSVGVILTAAGIILALGVVTLIARRRATVVGV